MTKPSPDKDHQFASTLASGIDLLLCFRAGEDWLANKELAERTRMSRPAVARLTHTLTRLGYLRHDVQQGRYALGAAVLSISHPLLASMRIRPIARPLMEALARDIRGAVSLGVRHLTHMVYVESARHDDYVLFPDIGAPLPMLSTAMGRAWLACALPPERRAVLNQIRVHLPQEYERHNASAAAALIEYGRHGYCSSRAEWHSGGHGFAVPLQGLVDNMQFVVNCGVLAAGAPFAQLRRDIAPQLVTLARSIEVMLGLH
jgi:DNA-binding IclR family transcriptional regulator